MTTSTPDGYVAMSMTAITHTPIKNSYLNLARKRSAYQSHREADLGLEGAGELLGIEQLQHCRACFRTVRYGDRVQPGGVNNLVAG